MLSVVNADGAAGIGSLIDKRIDETTGERKRFSSAILPPWCRKSPKTSEMLPQLCLHGLSTGGFVPAPEQFLSRSAGLSPATVTRLTAQWQADHTAFGERDLSGSDYVYVWADGTHLRIRPGEAKSCVPVLMGVRTDGTRELIAMADGYRESADSWAGLLRDCACRGMRTPVLAVGDGALGFWKKALQETYNAEDRDYALRTVTAFEKAYAAKFPKAVKRITDDVDELLAFYDFPAEHWIHPRTTDPIESIFATVRLRTKVTRGAGSAAAALSMVFKLVESAQARWRAVNAPHLVALVRVGDRFERGHLMEHPETVAA